MTRVGTVSAGPTVYPFPNGSGLNENLDGRPVLAFEYQGKYAAPTGYCLDSSTYSLATGNGQLQLRSCNGDSDFQLYVWAESGALIPVGPNNQAYFNGYPYPVWLGCSALNCANGQPVLASNIQGYNRPYEFQGGA